MLGNIQDSDIKLLRIFYVIAQCGGFSAAQAQLNLSQSAISTQMAQLEVRLGCRLCERGRGNFALTPEGEAVLRSSEKLFAALEDFRTDVAESQGRLTGELRLGLIDNTVTHENPVIRNAIAEFSAVAPGVSINIYVGDAVELEQQILDGRLHIAIGLFHHALESLEYLPLMDEQHMLYCANNHRFFHASDAELSDKDMRNAEYVSWGYIDTLYRWEPQLVFNEAAASPYTEGVAYLILSGRYIGYLPSHYAEFWVKQGHMRALKPETMQRSSPFSLIKRKSTRLSSVSSLFVAKLGLELQEDKS